MNEKFNEKLNAVTEVLSGICMGLFLFGLIFILARYAYEGNMMENPVNALIYVEMVFLVNGSMLLIGRGITAIVLKIKLHKSTKN